MLVKSKTKTGNIAMIPTPAGMDVTKAAARIDPVESFVLTPATTVPGFVAAANAALGVHEVVDGNQRADLAQHVMDTQSPWAPVALPDGRETYAFNAHSAGVAQTEDGVDRIEFAVGAFGVAVLARVLSYGRAYDRYRTMGYTPEDARVAARGVATFGISHYLAGLFARASRSRSTSA